MRVSRSTKALFLNGNTHNHVFMLCLDRSRFGGLRALVFISGESSCTYVATLTILLALSLYEVGVRCLLSMSTTTDVLDGDARDRVESWTCHVVETAESFSPPPLPSRPT